MWKMRTGFVFGLLAMGITAQAFDNIEIERKDVPVAALKTAEYYAPGVTFVRYAYEDEGATRIYEFEGKGVDGKHIEIDVIADGTLQEIEIEIDKSEIPVSVSIELSLLHKGFVIDFVEMSARPNGTIVYEFEGYDDAHNFIDVEISDNGRRLETTKYSKVARSDHAVSGRDIQ